MLNQRLAAAQAVRDTFLPLKRQADEAATLAAECLLTLQKARASSGMPLGTGSEPIADIARGVALLCEAQRHFAAAHPKLAALITDAGLNRFLAAGDDECPKANPFTTAQIVAVA